MIPRDCRRLAEVDFPIAVVSKFAAREKTIRHGHPSTLHLWWARRPLASSRAVLLALLLPDPCDPNCPPDFRTKAKNLLPQVGCGKGETDPQLREGLLKFIGDFANWDISANATYIAVARGLVKAAHSDETPLVVDPFAGGGSIPLEALRLGCEVFASDLNPVACLILKVMLEDIPRRGLELIDELRTAGAEIKKEAEKELAEFYPLDPDGARPIAYLWARTVSCEAPDCGAEIPLVRSFWLSKKRIRRRALKPRAVKARGTPPLVEFDIFEPKSDEEVQKGTVTRAKATCLCCGRTLAPDRVRAQLTAQRGGADTRFDAKGLRTGGARLLAVVMLKDGEAGRQFRLPKDRDYEAVWEATKKLAKMVAKPLENGLSAVPAERLPPIGTLGFRIQRYGVLGWDDFFTARQKVGLATLAGIIRARQHGQRELSLALGKLADLTNASCPWEPIAECPRNVLSNGRIKPSWDFAEAVLISDASGSFSTCVHNLVEGLLSLQGVKHAASVEVAAAQTSPIPDAACSVWFTDPPYYDAIPYAHLSDMFYVWHRRALPDEPILRNPFAKDSSLTPKAQELVQDEVQVVGKGVKDKNFFEHGMATAFKEGNRILADAGIGAVVFAHKTTEGWEALLSGMISGGWTITGSWPIATEAANRLRARDSAALATSVHLICRPRTEDIVGDWADVLRELPPRVADWMERLQDEGVRGADLVFACIGPALEIFSRYTKVETAEGREVKLDEYLAKVWEVVGRSALAQVLGTAEAKARNGAAGAVEEDARLTALFLWTLQATDGEDAEDAGDAEEDETSLDDEEDGEGSSGAKAKGFTLVFDVVRRFAQPLGIELPKWEGRIIEMKKGVVRLLPIAERAKQLFGEDGAQAVATRLEQDAALGMNPLQGMLFPEMGAAPTVRGRGTRGRGKRAAINVSDESLASAREATTLDRVHAAMLLQAGGRTNALRALLKAEQDRGTDFLRLANALSALYPKGSEEKRLLDAMLLAVPR